MQWMENSEVDLDTLVLDCIPKARFINEMELMDKFEQICKRHGVMSLPMQLKAALKRLLQSHLIIFKKGQGVKKL